MAITLVNRHGDAVSMQISQIENVSGTYESATPFLIKVLGDSTIDADIKPIRNKEYVTTKLDPGWNSELCFGIKNASGTIQIGR